MSIAVKIAVAQGMAADACVDAGKIVGFLNEYLVNEQKTDKVYTARWDKWNALRTRMFELLGDYAGCLSDLRETSTNRCRSTAFTTV
jgi:hypothetical protein